MFRSVKFRVIATFLIAIIVVVGIATFAGFRFVRWYEHERSDDDGIAAAQSCAAVMEIIGDTSADLSNPKDYETYREILRDTCKDSDMNYLYAYRCNLEDNTITYLMFVAADDEADAVAARERPYGTTLPVEFTEAERAALAGTPSKRAIEFDNHFGHTLDWVRAVDGWDGNVLAASSYSVEQQRTRVFRTLVVLLAPVVVALILVLIVQMLIMRRYIFNPLHTIADRMRSFSAEDASEFKPLNIKTNDEMSDIADAFEGMAQDISNYTSSIETLTEERVQANVELDIARRIQLGMVPERTEISYNSIQFAALSRAAREVGGDFYDAMPLEDGRIATVVGDVSGKGVAAALFMAMTKTMVRDGLQAVGKPAAVLNYVNAQLCKSNPEGMFATVFACILDPATGAFSYANAGHTPPLLVGDDARALDTEPGTLLGLFEDIDLKEGHAQLGQPECILLFTDGVTEAVNTNKEFLGEEAFANSLSAEAPFKTATDLIDATSRIVDDFAGGREQFDDLTAIALLRQPEIVFPESAVQVAPEMSSFGIIREAVFATDFDDPIKRKTCLACEEAFANIVSYSHAKQAWYAVEVKDDSLQVTLADNGTPFDPTTAVSPDKRFEDLDTGGMGINLVRDLTTDMRYTRLDGRNILVLLIDG